MIPPYSNRGVTLGPGDGGPVLDACFATVYAHPSLLLDHLEQALLDGGYETHRDHGPKVRFYAENALLLDGPAGHRLLSVRYGGQNFHPFVEAKGPPSGIVADCLRQFEFSPARLDSAYDLHGPTAFDDLHRIAKLFEETRGVKLDYAGAAIDNPDRGTTIYLGSRKSQAFVRIYQKGLKLAEELGLTGDQISDELRHWVRIELEFKPDKQPARLKARHLSPSELWGCSPWVRDFANIALSIDAKRVHMTERRETDHEAAVRHMLTQYGPTMLRQVELLGSWAAFTDFLRLRLEPVPEAVH